MPVPQRDGGNPIVTGVTRELAAHHDAAELSSPHVAAALAIHHAAPG